MDEVKPLRDFYLEKHQSRDVMSLVNRKLLIHKQLEKPTRTYVVYTDLHGSYEKYLQWMRTGMGYYHIAVSENLGQDYGPDVCRHYERLLLTVSAERIRRVEAFLAGTEGRFDHSEYFHMPVPPAFVETLERLLACNLTPRRVLGDLLFVLHRITRGDEHRIFKAVPGEFQENILTLYYGKDTQSFDSLLDGISGNPRLFHLVASFIVKLVIQNTFEKHVNLGDTFDRGDGADRLIAFYRTWFDQDVFTPHLHYLWGNHALLWLGASVGNPVLCVTALRVSLRYNNMDFLYRYGFSVERLKELARSCYRLAPTGAYTKVADEAKYSLDDAAKMTKVLLVLEAKLTLQYLRRAMGIPGQIDYTAEERRFTALLDLLPKGIPEDEAAWKQHMADNPLYSDVYFPTVDSDRPEQLTPEEQAVVDDLVSQFTTLPRFQDDLQWLFWKGEMYRVVDNTLYYHAALPVTPDMQLAEFKGHKGKELLDWIQRDLKRIGERWKAGQTPTVREQMLLWYLWCGSQSPFFCKSKMATLERAVFEETHADAAPLTTWKEEKDPYYKLIRDDRLLSSILGDFHAEKLVMGHTPVKTPELGRLSEMKMAFLIDGGASPAYGDKGLVLIVTPDCLYLAAHPSLEDLQKAESEGRLPDIQILPYQERTRTRLRDVEKGYFLKEELSAIDELLESRFPEVYDGYFRGGGNPS
ncbi:MAG: fructose-1,6-bisphosphatase [Deltaproteobacteria bacterium]|nr:fructose-1,6-bisphosphatase [Deltaproteobacteria bacterium]